MFTTDAKIIPISPMNAICPVRDRSAFVVYPYRLIIPNIPAVIKKTVLIDSAV